jgi:hypothetical protein
MTRALVVAAALVAAASPAGADVPAPAQNALAVELSTLVMPRANWERTSAGVADQTRQYIEASIRQGGGEVPPEFAARFTEEFRSLYAYEEIVDIQAGLLVKYYSEGELRELLAFYRSPLGQKAIRIMPEVTQDVNGQIMAILQQRMPALMERLRPVFEAPKAAPAAGKPKAPRKQAN